METLLDCDHACSMSRVTCSGAVRHPVVNGDCIVWRPIVNGDSDGAVINMYPAMWNVGKGIVN